MEKSEFCYALILVGLIVALVLCHQCCKPHCTGIWYHWVQWRVLVLAQWLKTEPVNALSQVQTNG
jgi:hypothetical protein